MKTAIKQAETFSANLKTIKARIAEGNEILKSLETYDEAYSYYFNAREALALARADLHCTAETAADYEVKYWKVLQLNSEIEQTKLIIASGKLQGSF